MNTTNPILPKINGIWWEFQSFIALRLLVAKVCMRGAGFFLRMELEYVKICF